MKTYTLDSLKEYQGKNSKQKLIVIHGKVYDVTDFIHRHPGGAKVIANYSGEDATDAWTAVHNDRDLVQRLMAPLQCGIVKDYELTLTPLQRDFRQLRQLAESSGWFRARPAFFLLHLLQCWLLELVAVLALWLLGVNAASWLLAAAAMCASQAQAGWVQHDYGHLCVFNSRRLNHLLHEFVIGHFKGASSHWWNFRHYLHHSKPNVHGTDPDITLPQLFLLGDKIPTEWGRQRRGRMPYQLQHQYFWLLGPPLLLPLYFHYEILYFVLRRRDYRDMIWAFSFFVKFFFIFNHFFSSWLVTLAFYMFVRYLESHWFVACTQMSHLPMDVDRDQRRDWCSLQVKATLNTRPGVFSDWFTGHLNYQIEHHLFPTMPRHSFSLARPHVQRLCAAHGLQYTEKPLATAMLDIVRSLKKSGRLWFDAYHLPG